MTNERAIQILENLISINGDVIIGSEDQEALEMAIRSLQQEVDLEKVVMIDNVIMNMTAEGYNNGYKTRPFYEEVLRRLNARKKEGRHP